MPQSMIWSFWNYWSCLKSDFTVEMWSFWEDAQPTERGEGTGVLRQVRWHLVAMVPSPPLLYRPSIRSWTLSFSVKKDHLPLPCCDSGQEMFNSSVWLLYWEKVLWQTAGQCLIHKFEVPHRAVKMTNSYQPACMQSLCVLRPSQHTPGPLLVPLLSQKYSVMKGILRFRWKHVLLLSLLLKLFFSFQNLQALSWRQSAEGRALHRFYWSFYLKSTDGTVLFSNGGHLCNAKYFITCDKVSYYKRLWTLGV